MPDKKVLDQIEELQNRYICALDNKDMVAWSKTFDESGASYICIAQENVQNNLPLALMMDDCIERIQDRVTFVNDVWAGTFEDYQTRHFTQRTTCEELGNNRYKVATNFTIICTPEQGQTNVMVAGVYEDEVFINGTAKFISKRAVMDTNVAPRYIVYPV